jgi:hypothetical protein
MLPSINREDNQCAISILHYWIVKSKVLGTDLSLSSRGRMTLGVGVIFCFISHTMTYQPEGLGLHIYSWPRQPAYAKMLV